MSQRKLCHKTKELGEKKPQTSLPKAPRKTQAPLCPLFTKQMQTNQLKPNPTLLWALAQEEECTRHKPANQLDVSDICHVILRGLAVDDQNGAGDF